MADGIYVSMNGAAARMAQLDSIADNLANVETPGFKAERPAFEAFLALADGRESSRVYPAAVATSVDLSKGTVTVTGDPMDVLPTGDAFLGVITSKGLALTRNGHLSVDASGTLTAAGYPVADKEGRAIIAPPGSTVRVDPSGAVFAGDVRLAEVGLWEPQGAVDRVAPSLIAPQDPTTLTPSADRLRLGELERANATALEAAVQLVAAQRHFETSMQALQTYKKLDDRATEVGRVR